MMELMVANRCMRRLLDEAGVTVALTYSGPYFTCQEMAGFSLSLMRLDAVQEDYCGGPAGRSAIVAENR